MKCDVFNETTRQCLKCETVFVESTKDCLKCQEGETFNSETKSCDNPELTCPPSKPYLGFNEVCYACPEPELWDPVLRECFKCKDDKVINPETLKCECPESKPNLNFNGTCVQCDTVFVENVKDCLKCEQNETYNATTKSCENPQFSCPEDKPYQGHN